MLKEGVGGAPSYPFFLLYIFSSWLNLRLHIGNELNTLLGSALKVCVVGGWVVVGGGGWVLTVNLVISFGFGQAEQ